MFIPFYEIIIFYTQVNQDSILDGSAPVMSPSPVSMNYTTETDEITHNTTSDDVTVISRSEDLDKRTTPPPTLPDDTATTPKEPDMALESNHIKENLQNGHVQSRQIDKDEVYQIIDSIRQTTNLSHELSCVALKVVLSELEAIYPIKILPFLEPIAAHLAEPITASEMFVSQTHDSRRLKVIFSKLADCKNDSEQRTWMLYEDEGYIVGFLTELTEIFVGFPKSCLTIT